MLRHFYRLMVVALGMVVFAGCVGTHVVEKEPIATGEDHDTVDEGMPDEGVVDEDMATDDVESPDQDCAVVAYHIDGTVSSAEGTPLQGIEISTDLSGYGANDTTTTGSDGGFWFFAQNDCASAPEMTALLRVTDIDGMEHGRYKYKEIPIDFECVYNRGGSGNYSCGNTGLEIVLEEGGCSEDEQFGNMGKNCKTDTECGDCLICVNAKCAIGCQSDADCLNYAGTKCNRALSRCLNTTANDGACDETNCSSGCCYADKGFLKLKCLVTATLQICGICKQGEIYMNSSQCVPAACKVDEAKCQTYNATVPNAQCFECDAETFLCQNDPLCGGMDDCVGCEFDAQGIVMNAQGDTLAGIEVVAYAGSSFETSVKTGPTGIFNFELQANYGCDIGVPETIPLSFNDIDGAANGGSFESTQMDAVLPWTESGVNPCKYQKNDFQIKLDKVGNDDDTLLPDE